MMHIYTRAGVLWLVVVASTLEKGWTRRRDTFSSPIHRLSLQKELILIFTTRWLIYFIFAPLPLRGRQTKSHQVRNCREIRSTHVRFHAWASEPYALSRPARPWKELMADVNFMDVEQCEASSSAVLVRWGDDLGREERSVLNVFRMRGDGPAIT
jgi:hypothetical protein